MDAQQLKQIAECLLSGVHSYTQNRAAFTFNRLKI